MYLKPCYHLYKPLKRLTPHRRLKPAAPLQLLAMVNDQQDSSSTSGGSVEDSRGGPQSGDLYIGTFGDVISCKQNNIVRLGFQNVGVFLPKDEKLKKILLDLAYINGI